MWPSLCSVVVTALLGAESAPQLLDLKPSVSEMWPVLGGLGEKPMSIPLLDLSTREYTLWCCLPPTVLGFTGYTVLGTALGPASIVEMQAQPGCPQMLC